MFNCKVTGIPFIGKMANPASLSNFLCPYLYTFDNCLRVCKVLAIFNCEKRYEIVISFAIYRRYFNSIQIVRISLLTDSPTYFLMHVNPGKRVEVVYLSEGFTISQQSFFSFW